jgi:short-subunit dehydrogenase
MNPTNSVLIIGATSGIAKSLANEYSGLKYDLILLARNVNRLKPLQSDLQLKYGNNIILVEFELLETNFHEKILNDFSFLPETTISAVGYLGNHDLALTDFNEANKILQSNFTAIVSLLNLIANRYASKGKGTIVGISSVAGDRGRMSNYIYGSAKAGFSAYLSGLRNRMYNHNVHVITVKPGFVDTRMTEHLTLPPLLTSSPQHVARKIIRAIQKKKNMLYISSKWKWIMNLIKIIPERIFKKMKL